MGKQLPPIFFSGNVTTKILEGRDCKGFTFFFLVAKARDGTVGREKLLGLHLQIFGGESCSQRWHSWKAGTAGTTSSNFFGGDPAARDGTVGREKLLGLHLQIFSQRWDSWKAGTAGTTS